MKLVAKQSFMAHVDIFKGFFLGPPQKMEAYGGFIVTRCHSSSERKPHPSHATTKLCKVEGASTIATHLIDSS